MDYDLILYQARNLRDATRARLFTTHGLCANLGLLLIDPNDLREVFWSSWPEWSGCSVYPVPAPDGWYWDLLGAKRRAQRAYLDTANMPVARYCGPYGESRLRLLDHIIKVCEERVES